jgi:hypothetical protein
MANKVKQLTAEQQVKLRNRAKTELERLEVVYSDEQTRERIDRFKDKFGICEIVYKVILEDHKFNKTGQHPKTMWVNMRQAPQALKYAGYDFNNDLLTHLFGGEEKVGIRSVKKLRDSLTHSVNHRAIDELVSREDELNGYMDQFLSKIREFDSAA